MGRNESLSLTAWRVLSSKQKAKRNVDEDLEVIKVSASKSFRYGSRTGLGCCEEGKKLLHAFGKLSIEQS